MSPGNAAAPGVETEGGAGVQHGDADKTRVSREREPWVGPSDRAQRRSIARRRRRLQGDAARSRASYELSDLLAELYPSKTRMPSTYGMSPDARRKYAAYLMAHGWQAHEVRDRIAAPEVCA